MHRRSLGLGVFVLLVVSGVAVAAPINYGNRMGTTVNYLAIREDVRSSNDSLPLYGSPTITGNTLKFPTTGNFASSSPNGAANGDTTDGELRFTIQAKPGQQIDSFLLSEFGDFNLLAALGGSAIASVRGTLFDTDNFTNTQMSQNFNGVRDHAPFTPSPFFLIGPGADGDGWTASLTKTYALGVVTRVDIILNNTLSTAVNGGAAAFIAKKGVSFTVGTSTIVPEPATLLLSGAGIALLLVRRRAA